MPLHIPANKHDRAPTNRISLDLSIYKVLHTKSRTTTNPLPGGAAMTDENGNDQNENRWFLIECKRKNCGSVIINATKCIDACRKVKNGKPMLICPSCLTAIIGYGELAEFFKCCEDLRKKLELTSTIRQVQPGYLDAIKDLRKLLPDKS